MSPQYVSAVMLVLAGWVAFFPIFVGWGLLVRRALDRRAVSGETLFEAFWLGWACVLFFLQVWHLGLPVGGFAFLTIAGTGLAGLLWNGLQIRRLTVTGLARHVGYLLVICVLALWLANHAIYPHLAFDTGLYHLPTIRWLESFPIVPGLGNLHGRFAFNCSYFLYVALLDVGPWVDKSHHLANSLLLVVLTSQICFAASRLFVRSELRLYRCFYLLMLAPALTLAVPFYFNFSSPSPDFAVYMLEIMLAAYLLAFLDSSKHDPKETEYKLLYIGFLSIAGITVKLSFLAFGVGSLLVAIGVAMSAKGILRAPLLKMLGAGFTGLLVGLLPWMARSVMLSGYVVYPLTATGLPVEWRIPRASVVNNAKWVLSWARMPKVHHSEVLGSWDWLDSWLHGLSLARFEVVVPLVLIFISLVVIVYCQFAKCNEIRTSAPIQWFLLPPVVSIIYWFMTAPDLRFLGGSLWILGAGAVAIAITRFGESKRVVQKVIIVGLVLFQFQMIFVGGREAFLKAIVEGKGLADSFRQLYSTSALELTKPLETGKFFQIPSRPFSKFVSNSGLALNVPIDKREGQCWDAPLPCTLHPHPNLRLRQTGELGSGFVVDPYDDNDPAVGINQ